MKQERLQSVYDYLLNMGKVHSVSGFADALGVSRSSLSSALNGNEKYLTRGLCSKIVAKYPFISLDWLLEGVGTISDDQGKQEQGASFSAANSIIDLAASLIKEVEALRQSLEAERTETRRLNEDLRRTIKAYREVKEEPLPVAAESAE